MEIDPIISSSLSDCLNPRSVAPSLPGSSTSSSWLPSPGCASRESSCTSCWSRSLRANTPGRSTTMCPVTSSPPSWSASPQPSTTRATGRRKRECGGTNPLKMWELTLDAPLRELIRCGSFSKKKCTPPTPFSAGSTCASQGATLKNI